MTRCEDCKGTGRYVGLFEVSNCASCKGEGKTTSRQEDVLQDLLELNVDVFSNVDKFEVIVKPQAIPKVEANSKIYVYDCGWIETTVVQITDTPRGPQALAIYHHGNIKMMVGSICWNATQQRHEYIRHGTPVY
jgi:RecJ-like exonuclease